MLRRFFLASSLAVCGLTLATVLADDPKPKAKAAHQNYTETLVDPTGNKIPFDMIAIPGGEFTMGSPDTEKDRNPDEGPQVKVKIKPFWMGKCEVTWDEFDLYFKLNNPGLKPDEGGCDTAKEAPKKDGKVDPADAVSKPTKPYVDETYGHERDKRPAICMTHHAAMKYCEWLSIKTGKTYRLATEAEWEYACRAGSTTPHSIPADGKLDDYAWYKENSPDKTHPRGTTHEVGTKKANAFGLHDMHGNVMEWVMDHYVADAYTRFGKNQMGGFTLAPCFKPTENKWAHVARGGHFKSEPKDLRSAARSASSRKWMNKDPQEPQSIWWLTNFDIVGFRIVRPVEDDELKGLTSKVVRENDETFKPE